MRVKVIYYATQESNEEKDEQFVQKIEFFSEFCETH